MNGLTARAERFVTRGTVFVAVVILWLLMLPLAGETLRLGATINLLCGGSIEAFAQSRGSSVLPDGCEGMCPASVMNEITAAFATQGYWMQSNLIYQIGATDFGLWAPLLYIMAVFSGLIAMAMGQPPRIYLWFLLGPAIYNWLIFTPVERMGVSWQVATEVQDQKEVWKLAEVGLLNDAEIIRRKVKVSADDRPDKAAEVSLLFAWFDELISAQIQFFVNWSGIYMKRVNSDSSTNTHLSSAEERNKAWFILSNSKWPMLENITSAALSNQDLREAFVTFMASECGDILAEHIDKAKFISAGGARGAKLPDSVFKGDGGEEATNEIIMHLKATIIPPPVALISLLLDGVDSKAGDEGKTEFRYFCSELQEDKTKSSGCWRHIDCNYYLWVLVQGFRWEAGNLYNQVVAEGTDANIPADTVISEFLYGWRMGYAGNKHGEKIDTDKQRQYIINLILLHLFRNEMALAPSPANYRFSSAERTASYAEAYVRNVGSKSKYGELYTWAKLMPYIQGVLLYFLTAAYPIVCMLIVIPGWWKVIFTWMGFFAWAKSWDAGFAIVMAVERSIWAMLGNSTDAARFNDLINKMYELGKVKLEPGITIPKAPNGVTPSCDFSNLIHCMVPKVTNDGPTCQIMAKAIQTLDKGFLMATNLDLDLSNAYYIYIMSALYFAVPAVTGQLLLGAKSGASGMISTMVGGSAQEGGRASGNAFTGEIATRSHNNVAAVGQTSFAKGLRNTGLAMAAIQAGNMGLDQDLRAAEGAAGNAVSEQLQNFAGLRGRKIGAGLDALVSAGSAGQKFFFPGSSKALPAGSVPVGGGGGGGVSSGAVPSGSEGSAAATLSPSSPGGGGASRWQRAAESLGRMTGAVTSRLGPAANIGVAAARLQAEWDSIADNEAATHARIGYAIGGFEAQALGKGFNVMANRYSSWGQQQAGEAQWRAMRNFSSQLTGQGAALGIFAGAFTAGQKPMHLDGMAGAGLLNTYARGGSQDVYTVDDARAAFMWGVHGYGPRVALARQGLDRMHSDGSKVYNSRELSLGNVFQRALTAPFDVASPNYRGDGSHPLYKP